MASPPLKLVVIGLQQTFLQMVLDQIRALFGDQLSARSLAFNELESDPPRPDETLIYFSKGLKAIVEKMAPPQCSFIYARRETLLCNMQELFSLTGPYRILVVNDVKTNTDEMTRDLVRLGLPHEFIPYYPDAGLPEKIDYVVTAGERMLVPEALNNRPVIDIGLRFISLATVYTLFTHFGLPFDHADLAHHHMRAMMGISEKWPVLGRDRFLHASRLGNRSDTKARYVLKDFVSNSPSMKRLLDELRQVAPTLRPVHIFGRTGTGKSMVAQAVHNASPVSEGPFVSINCAARSRESLEKEIFGWEDGQGTFEGLFDAAGQGSLCIEEVGELSAGLQARLLQALSEARIIRAGGRVHVPVNVRIITTSSRKLKDLKDSGMNPDLLLALTAHVCRVPDLADRMADFEPLIRCYLDGVLKKPEMVVDEETLTALKAHAWEGNVQELFNVIQHMACMTRDQTLARRYLPYYVSHPKTAEAGAGGTADLPATALEAEQKKSDQFKTLADQITRYGFLEESRAILAIYQAGKEQNRALGRSAVLEHLHKNGYPQSVQQLRLKLERMDNLGLLIVRPGRGGTTISRKGETFLDYLARP